MGKAEALQKRRPNCSGHEAYLEGPSTKYAIQRYYKPPNTIPIMAVEAIIIVYLDPLDYLEGPSTFGTARLLGRLR